MKGGDEDLVPVGRFGYQGNMVGDPGTPEFPAGSRVIPLLSEGVLAKYNLLLMDGL